MSLVPIRLYLTRPHILQGQYSLYRLGSVNLVGPVPDRRILTILHLPTGQAPPTFSTPLGSFLQVNAPVQNRAWLMLDPRKDVDKAKEEAAAALAWTQRHPMATVLIVTVRPAAQEHCPYEEWFSPLDFQAFRPFLENEFYGIVLRDGATPADWDITVRKFFEHRWVGPDYLRLR